MVRLGVSIRSGYPGADPRTGAQYMIERAAAARQAGLHSLFVGDHHGSSAPYYQNSPILGRLLAEWDGADRVTGALYLLPLWNPVLLAEQVGTLAALAGGRFVLQAALGDGEKQFAAMGADRGLRVTSFESALGTVRQLLSGEKLEQDIRISPVPPEPVDVWIGAAADAAIDRAARLGDGWIALPSLPLPQARAQLALYRARRAAASLDEGYAVIRRDIHVGADAADAARVIEPVAGDPATSREAVIAGGPGEVAEAFRQLGEIGYDEILVRHVAQDQAEVLASFERLGTVLEDL